MGTRGLSRRRFGQLLAAGAGVGVASGALAYVTRDQWLLAVRDYYGHTKKNASSLPPSPTGSLDPAARQALASCVPAIVPFEVDVERYLRFFDWHALNAPGYRVLYETFAQRLIDAARSAHGQALSRCSVAQCRELLLALHPPEDGSLQRRLLVFLDPQRILFEAHLFGEIVELFDRTDAWIVLGYDAWPGTPRGLRNYTRPMGEPR